MPTNGVEPLPTTPGAILENVGHHWANLTTCAESGHGPVPHDLAGLQCADLA